MDLSSLKPAEKNKKKKRIGRGPGSGHGKTSCKGHKGQNSRAGGGTPPGFEGGQMPMIRKIPKRGFNNHMFRTDYAILNLNQLDSFEKGGIVSLATCKKKGLVPSSAKRLKILGNGSLDRSLTVVAHKISKATVSKVLSAKGKIEEVKK